MKKTVSMLLAVIVAAIAICTFATSVFAAPDLGIPEDPRLDGNTTTTVATTAAPTTTATTAAPTTTATTAASTTAAETTTTTEAATESTTLQDITATRAPGQTVIDEGETTAAPTKATTKKPAANVSVIPSTGSSVAVPVIALLALAASTAAVVKTKKDN